MARLNVIDCSSLFAIADATAKLHGDQRYNLNYGALLQRLADARREFGFALAETNLAIVAVDPSSEPQKRFVDALLRMGYEVDTVDFHDAFVSLPPGQLPGEDSGYRGIISLAPRIALLAGLLAKDLDSQLVVVTHSYDVWWPLQMLARRLNRNGGVGLAYFSTLLDFRLRRTVMLIPTSNGRIPASNGSNGVQWHDLQDSLYELLGAREPQASVRPTGGGVWNRI
jgi:hypothetical protein